MSQKIIIAIDGFSSCGKSTLARDLARKLGYRYIDTGAMYRAVTLYFFRNHIDIQNESTLSETLSHITLDFEYDKDNGKQSIILNGENVENELRNPVISDRVSAVSSIKAVRHFLVKQQQAMGLQKGIVMDGRDIGSVVFPDAELKLFMTADEETRAIRRYEELKNSGSSISLDEVRQNIKKRDYIDSHREESPLIQADDAIVLDSTHVTTEQQLDIAYNLALKLINKS